MGFIVAFLFLSNQENLCIIYDNLDLFYDIYNTITQHNQRQTHYLSSILTYFDLSILSESKGSFITSCASLLIMISILSLFECITYSSSLSMEEIKFFAIVDLLSPPSEFLRLFMMLFKNGLILLRYSSSDSVLFLSMLLSYSI